MQFQENNNLKNEIESRNKDNLISRNKLKQSTEEIKSINSVYNELLKTNETNINQLQSEIKKNSTLNKEITTLKADNNKNIQEINQLGERLNSLRSQNKDYEKSMTMLQSVITKENDIGNSNITNISKYTVYIENLQSKLSNLEKNETSLVAANKKLKESLNNDAKKSHKILQEKEKMIQSLSVKIREKDCVIKKYSGKNDTSKDIITPLNSYEMQD